MTGPDRIARITVDAQHMRRPSIPDTWWLIAHIWTLRQQLADAEEAIRQWATIAATGHDTEGERSEDH